MTVMPWREVATRLGCTPATARRIARTTPGVRLVTRPGGTYAKGIHSADLSRLVAVVRPSVSPLSRRIK